MKGTAVLLLGCSVVLCSPRYARADPVTFQFAGVVTEASGVLDRFRAGPVGVGTPFSGLFTYDPARAFQADPLGFFFFVDPPAAMTIRVGSLVSTTDAGVGFRPDSGVLFGRGFTAPAMRFRETFDVLLGLGNRFPHAAPTPATLLGAFDTTQALFRLTLADIDEDPHAELFGELSSFTLSSEAAPVPEPGTIVLVGTGALLAGLRKRTRSR